MIGGSPITCTLLWSSGVTASKAGPYKACLVSDVLCPSSSVIKSIPWRALSLDTARHPHTPSLPILTPPTNATMQSSAESAESPADIYDSVYDSLLSMPARLVLARSTYGVDFGRHVVANNVWEYRSLGGLETFETILVGEIRPAECGTRFSAKGNHFLGSMVNVRISCGVPTLTDCVDGRACCSSPRSLTTRRVSRTSSSLVYPQILQRTSRPCGTTSWSHWVR